MSQVMTTTNQDFFFKTPNKQGLNENRDGISASAISEKQEVNYSFLRAEERGKRFILPMEVLIRNKHKELLLKFWAKFIY